MQLWPTKRVGINGQLFLDFYSFLHMTQTGTTAQANGFDFNTYTSSEGFLLEQFKEESSGFYCDGDYAVIYSPGDRGRLLRVYDEDGMVEKWYVDASGYAHTNSDKNKKENIKNIQSITSKLKKVNGVKFNFKKEVETSSQSAKTLFIDSSQNSEKEWPGGDIVEDLNKYDPSVDEYYGFIAQEVEDIFPELVNTNEEGDKFVSYTEFIPLLVEAYKEQQEQIEKLLAKSFKSTEQIEAGLGSEKAFLKQNKPNPFNELTLIDFYLPSGVQSATIYLYDLTGKQIKSIDVVQRENGSITIFANEFQPGMYKYALVADGIIVGAETMILTD